MKIPFNLQWKAFAVKLRIWWGQVVCIHDYERVGESNAIAIDKCKKCGHTMFYGSRS